MANDAMQRLRTGVASVVKNGSYDLSDRGLFNTSETAVELRGHRMDLFFYRSLLPYSLEDGGGAQCRWTFVVLAPRDGYRERFLVEFEKRESGQSFSEEIVADYFATFAPGMPDCEDLHGQLVDVLNAQTRELSFAPLVTTPLADFSMAAVFVAMQSRQS